MGEFKLDFEKFADYLCRSDRRLVNLYYYNAPLKKQYGEKEYKAQQKFFSYLERIPNFILRLGRLEMREASFTLEEILNNFDHPLAKEIINKVGEKRLREVNIFGRIYIPRRKPVFCFFFILNILILMCLLLLCLQYAHSGLYHQADKHQDVNQNISCQNAGLE